MARKSQWVVRDPSNGQILELLTLYGDADSDAKDALRTMLSEAIAITGDSVLVSHSVITTGADRQGG